MKYGLFLKLLRSLIYIKRFFWWIGGKLQTALGVAFDKIWYAGAYIYYKFCYLFKRMGIEGLDTWLLNRPVLQFAFFLLLLLVAVPETKFFAGNTAALPGQGAGQKTIAYALLGPNEDYDLPEMIAESRDTEKTALPTWREGTLQKDPFAAGSSLDASWRAQDLSAAVAGGTALSKPMISPYASITDQRRDIIQYVVEPGDSLSSIAYQFDVSVATILWENGLGLRSIIRPGDILRVPPTTGVIHAVRKGDTLRKIAALYESKIEDIISFNKLKEDGSDLLAGEKIVVPDGVKPQERTIARAPRTLPALRKIAAPPRSLQRPSLAGFVWPTAVRLITQYFSWRHYALDIAGGNLSTPIYASKSGTVEVSQCGWNRGYGCYVMINHGGGIKTLYGHNSRLLVSPGDQVDTGETIALMGNTGRVRGRTGIHVHFEIQINGSRVNPLGYVR